MSAMNIKLLYFCSDYQIGLSALLTDQLLSIANKGVNVYAVAGEKEQEPGLAESLYETNIKIERIDGLDVHNGINRKVAIIKDIVQNHDIDVIHVQNNWQLAIAGCVKYKLLGRKRIKIAYTLHGFRHNNPIKSRIAQLVIGSALFLLADHVICMTEYLVGKFKLLSYKIKKIPLGIKDDYFIKEYVSPKTEHLNIVFPAQFREGKNQDLIIRAFNQYVIQASDRNSKLILPGEGSLKDQMVKLVKKFGLENQILFPGLMPKDKIRQLYLASNIAIVASNSETFGQSIVEPFVLGRCVLSTPVGIAPEIINNHINGYLFHTEEELTKILLHLSEHKEILTEIGHRNFLKRDQFRWDIVTDNYIKEILV